MNIAKFSVKQPVLVNLLTFFLIVAGILSLKRLPREVFPSVPTGKISVVAIYPGVSPEEIESLVGIKIEREIKDIDGIKKIITNSAEGVSTVTIETDEGLSASEVSKVALDVQAAVGRIPDFPSDMDPPIVKEIKFEIPLLWVGIKSDLSAKKTRVLAKDLRDKLEKIPNVSSVKLMGMQDREFRVEIDPEKMISYNLIPGNIISAINRRKQDIPGGNVKLKKGEYLIKIRGKVETKKQIENIILKSSSSGAIRIKDVAKVIDGLQEAKIITRVQGSRSIYFVMYKKKKGDAIDIVNAGKKLMEKWVATAPQGVTTNTLFDSSKYIKRRQATLYSNGLMGLVLVVIILFIFLSFKTALLTAIGIPVAFFGTFVVMYFLGITFNMMAMFGMIMALGMIVDDAIVVVENIYRGMLEGKTPKKAAIDGATEVFWPVIGSVSTTIIAFSTLTFMPGQMGKILGIVPAVVSIALAISLIEAIFVLPSHMAEWIKAPKRKKNGKSSKKIHLNPDGTESLEAGWFLAFREGFAKILRFVTKIWPISIAVFVALFILVMNNAKNNMEFVPFPDSTVTQVTIDLETTTGTKLEFTEKIVGRLEKLLSKAPKTEVESYFCMVGSMMRGHSMIQGSHLAQCTVTFANDGHTKPRTSREIVAKWRAELNNFSDLDSVNLALKRNGPPQGKPIEILVSGPSYKKCVSLAHQVEEYGRKIKGVTDITNDSSLGKREINIDIKDELAAEYGFDPATLGFMIRNMFAGGIASKVQKNDEDMDIVVKYPDARRRSIDELRNLELFSPVTKGRVSLRAIADITPGRGAGRLVRIDEVRTVTVLGDIDTDLTNATRVSKQMKIFTKKLAAENPRYSFKEGGEMEKSAEIMSSIVMAAILSILGIYIILATIFQSFLQPFIVLMAIPFGAVGVIFGHWVHGMNLSMISMMGVVGLLGVVVNDSLVMVDFINNEMKKGIPIKQAVVDGGKLRLRPVILTTLTTIFGLLPMALGIMGSEEFLAPMAISMVWGLGFATFLTLFLVPCAYLMIDFIKRMMLKPFHLIGRLFSRKEVEND